MNLSLPFDCKTIQDAVITSEKKVEKSKCENNVIAAVRRWDLFSIWVSIVWKLQCKSARFIAGTIFNFLGFTKNYSACIPSSRGGHGWTSSGLQMILQKTVTRTYIPLFNSPLTICDCNLLVFTEVCLLCSAIYRMAFGYAVPKNVIDAILDQQDIL